MLDILNETECFVFIAPKFRRVTACRNELAAIVFLVNNVPADVAQRPPVSRVSAFDVTRLPTPSALGASRPVTGWIPLEGEVWVDPGLGTLGRIEALLPGYRLIRNEAFPAIRGQFSLNQSKQAAYSACLGALLRNVQAAADGRESLVVSLSEAAGALETALLATQAARCRSAG